jgi:hypothetical protein
LDDDGVASALLLVPARAPRRWEPEDIASDHLSPSTVGRASQGAPG